VARSGNGKHEFVLDSVLVIRCSAGRARAFAHPLRGTSLSM